MANEVASSNYNFLIKLREDELLAKKCIFLIFYYLFFCTPNLKFIYQHANDVIKIKWSNGVQCIFCTHNIVDFIIAIRSMHTKYCIILFSVISIRHYTHGQTLELCISLIFM